MRGDVLGRVLATHRSSTAEERIRGLTWTGVIGVGGRIAVVGQPLEGFLAAGGARHVVLLLARIVVVRQRRLGGDRIDRHEGGLTIDVRGDEPVTVSWNELGPLHAHRARSTHDVPLSASRRITRAAATRTSRIGCRATPPAPCPAW